jgi:hypothetical protein
MSRLGIVFVAGLALVGLAVAGCGGGSKLSGSVAGSSGYGAKLEFSMCMRTHGVPSFPDPSPNGAGAGERSSSLDGIVIPSTIDMQSPAFQAAVRSCRQVLTGGSPPPAITERQKQAALATARCIRRHGFPSWPDPTFSSGVIGIDSGSVDVRSPAFKRASAACGTP